MAREHTEGVPDRIVVRPSGPLSGTVPIAGAKNSALKLMAATVLAEGTFELSNIPRITDVDAMAELLQAIGLSVTRDGSSLTVVNAGGLTPEPPYQYVERMRASIVVLGPLLARYGWARVSMPGGDDFGPRPIDMHLQALEQLGATVDSSHGALEVRADQLLGARIKLDFPSVGATENALMASVLAKGETVIENAAREPEIAELAAFLNRMGANVVGGGTPTITIEGVDRLEAVDHEAVPDRLEAATFLTAVGIAGGEVTLTGARADHMEMLVHKLATMGMRISPDAAGMWAMASGRLRSVDVATLPYPGLATDYKPFVVALLSVADGVGIVTENLFQGRFRYVDELQAMGADIRTEGHHAVVRGVRRLRGATVRAHDIRAGAALVAAGLAADGETTVEDVHHIDRGYERFVEKLAGIGADVQREG